MLLDEEGEIVYNSVGVQRREVLAACRMFRM